MDAGDVAGLMQVDDLFVLGEFGQQHGLVFRTWSIFARCPAITSARRCRRSNSSKAMAVGRFNWPVLLAVEKAASSEDVQPVGRRGGGVRGEGRGEGLGRDWLKKGELLRKFDFVYGYDEVPVPFFNLAGRLGFVPGVCERGRRRGLVFSSSVPRGEVG